VNVAMLALLLLAIGAILWQRRPEGCYPAVTEPSLAKEVDI